MAKNDNVSCETYNGWKNYETWLINLWLTNDGDDDYIKESYFDSNDIATITTTAGEQYGIEEIYNFSVYICEYVDMALSELNIAGMFSDLLNASISRVDWYEIAESWLVD